MKLVTTEQAARHLRLDDLDDAEIALELEDKIAQASHLVLDYLKVADLDTWQDSAGEPLDVPPLVQAATLTWLAQLWQYRAGNTEENLELGEVPRSVSNMLWRYRTPAFG